MSYNKANHSNIFQKPFLNLYYLFKQTRDFVFNYVKISFASSLPENITLYQITAYMTTAKFTEKRREILRTVYIYLFLDQLAITKQKTFPF